MKRLFLRITFSLFCVLTLLPATAQGQSVLLADFEDGTAGKLKVNTDYQGSLFTVKPRVVDNPSKTGLNTSEKCVGATNVADADWWKNFLILDLKEPVTISDENRILTMLAYRSIQPKEMRIGFNTHEESGQLYQGNLVSDGTWERISIDLADYAGQTLRSIYIVLSCNWSDPRSGWGEAAYCFDDITLSAGEALPPVTLAIDASKTFQTIQDFGASDCWTAEYVGDYFTADREKAAKWLFSQQMDANGNPEGIGLSCWRVNLGAGSADQGANSNIEDETRRAECFLKEDGSYDWTRCNGQQWFMQQAKSYGVDHFLLFSNSAPVYFTKNGKANANNQNISCNLKDDCYDDFAEFLATTTKHFADEGYHVTYIDPVNEPRFDWKDGQEGSPWENTNIASLAKELDKSIRSRQLAAKILIPEASSWDLLYGGSGRASKQIDAFFDSSNSSTYIGDLPSLAKVVAGHSYWTFGNNSDLKNVREKVRDEAEKYGVEVMQTEWSMLDAAPAASAGFPASYDAATKMDIALYLGKLIHCDLTFGNMSAWSYWTAFAQEKWGQKNRFYLIRMNAQGDTGDESYGDIRKGGTLTADKNLWVVGNYSRFIRPGYQRIQLADDGDMNALLGSAWLSPDGQEAVAVLVNMKRSSRKVGLAMAEGGITSVKAYVTDKDHDLELDASLRDASDMDIPARSVVTVVMKLGGSGIGHVTTEAEADNWVWTLDGRQITQPRRGIYIKNGKKYIVK